MYLALHSVFYFILQENKTHLPQRMLTSGRVIKLGVSQTMEYIPVYWTNSGFITSSRIWKRSEAYLSWLRTS